MNLGKNPHGLNEDDFSSEHLSISWKTSLQKKISEKQPEILDSLLPTYQLCSKTTLQANARKMLIIKEDPFGWKLWATSLLWNDLKGQRKIDVKILDKWTIFKWPMNNLLPEVKCFDFQGKYGLKIHETQIY